jgi:hypothetical protein
MLGAHSGAGRESRDDLLLIQVHDLHVLAAEAPFCEAGERGIFPGRIRGQQHLPALERFRILADRFGFVFTGHNGVAGRLIVGDTNRQNVEPLGAEGGRRRAGAADIPRL